MQERNLGLSRKSLSHHSQDTYISRSPLCESQVPQEGTEFPLSVSVISVISCSNFRPFVSMSVLPCVCYLGTHCLRGSASRSHRAQNTLKVRPVRRASRAIFRLQMDIYRADMERRARGRRTMRQTRFYQLPASHLRRLGVTQVDCQPLPSKSRYFPGITT